MGDSLGLRFLYNTVSGRMVLKILVNPKISEFAGVFLDSKFSKWIIPLFVKRNHIDLTNVIVPQNGFSSFNEFFSRRRWERERDYSAEELISPCDAFLTVVPIKKDTIFDVKHTKFSLQDLLKNRVLAERFIDGTALIFRLTPNHYHRYGYAVNGNVVGNKKIKGVLHCVRPIATRSTPVFAQNSREFQVLNTKKFGTIVQMEVGALFVGKIVNHNKALESVVVKAGTEKGYFEFGGSTIILLLQKDKVVLSDSLIKRRKRDGEIAVTKGEVLGKNA